MFWKRKKKEVKKTEIDIFFLLTELQNAADSEKRNGNSFHWLRYMWAIAAIRHLTYQRDHALGLLEQGEINLHDYSKKIRKDYYSFTFTSSE